MKVVNCTRKTYLPCFYTRRPRTWPRWLAWAKFWYNTSFHSLARMTPFHIVYGRDPPLLIHWVEKTSKVPNVIALIIERNAILDEFKHNLHRA